MNKHPLVYELQKLKDSSKEAVAHSDLSTDDAFKRYLHIERYVETVLRDIVQKASQVPHPVLLLICGNVGDGKSHLLSCLNNDVELRTCYQSFSVHNDATESFSPDENCIQTLTHILEPFADDNIDKGHCCKQILAINLGTLSNFLEERKDRFSKLKHFVENQGILELAQIKEDTYREGSIFQYINFTNYHFFELTEEGIKPTIFQKLLDRLALQEDSNPVFAAYQRLLAYEWSDRCPVRYNYEFLFDPNHRAVLADLLVKAIIKEKQIISFRHLLNFVHDMLVPHQFSYEDLEQYGNKIKSFKFKTRVRYYTPYYLFEHPTLSKLFATLTKLDPCADRDERLDELAIQLFTSTSPIEVFKQHVQHITFYLRKIVEALNSDQDALFKLFIRLAFFQSRGELFTDPYFQAFTKALYAFNRKDALGLRSTNEIVKAAVEKWNGSTHGKNNVMLPSASKRYKYRVFKNISLQSVLPTPDQKANIAVLHQFFPQLRFEFRSPVGQDTQQIDVDYALYVLLCKINQGYRPNKLDRNNYIIFVRFVDLLINTGNSGSTESMLYVDEINLGGPLDYSFSQNEYGEYVFEKL
ncbi:DNA phosphorothioation-dependent restriction protein DptF [Pontibacter anaerobius]|uniref:DNA phosphorothioation-dependent restriction protein DptF n=1 Tax=Pontibacter anaerobius TaxID=2993940 RepID=A0ABT3RHX8_9BACT|nr:DNA phosphorothioation-dependent restriction protein DptF [Pontibacter anaerobius]MCX2741452.1 DNA phosphorothioation-dependent restriction protein DptF [Pontibacter anaerobius]